MAANKQKVKEIKNQIILAQEELEQLIVTAPTADANLTQDQIDHQAQEFKSNLAKKRAILSSLREELKITKLNKNLSSAFEWIPSPPNRRMRKAARQLRKA